MIWVYTTTRSLRRHSRYTKLGFNFLIDHSFCCAHGAEQQVCTFNLTECMTRSNSRLRLVPGICHSPTCVPLHFHLICSGVFDPRTILKPLHPIIAPKPAKFPNAIAPSAPTAPPGGLLAATPKAAIPMAGNVHASTSLCEKLPLNLHARSCHSIASAPASLLNVNATEATALMAAPRPAPRRMDWRSCGTTCADDPSSCRAACRCRDS